MRLLPGFPSPPCRIRASRTSGRWAGAEGPRGRAAAPAPPREPARPAAFPAPPPSSNSRRSPARHRETSRAPAPPLLPSPSRAAGHRPGLSWSAPPARAGSPAAGRFQSARASAASRIHRRRSPAAPCRCRPPRPACSSRTAHGRARRRSRTARRPFPGARSRGQSRCRAAFLPPAGRCRSPSAPAPAPSCRDQCAPPCRR